MIDKFHTITAEVTIKRRTWRFTAEVLGEATAHLDIVVRERPTFLRSLFGMRPRVDYFVSPRIVQRNRALCIFQQQLVRVRA